VVGQWLRLIDAVELAKYAANSGPDLLAGAIRAHGRLLSPKEYRLLSPKEHQRQKLCIVPDTGPNSHDREIKTATIVRLKTNRNYAQSSRSVVRLESFEPADYGDDRPLSYMLRFQRGHKGRRAMLLPAQFAWFEPVLIASIVVFIIDLVGNSIAFNNRYLNALVSAILFAIVFGALVYFGYGSVSMSVTTTPSPTAPAQTQK
jgi:hypothetical protein